MKHHMTKKLLTGIVLFVIYTLPGKAQVNATASEGLKKLDEASTKVGAMAWKGSVEVAAWTFSQRSTDPAKGGDNRAAELVAAGETDAQGDAAMLEMPLKLVQGRTKFLYCSTDGKPRRITPVRNGVFGLTEDGFHYTLYSITGMRLSKENEWKVSTMNRVPVMEFPGLLLQKAESQGNNLGDPQLWFISVDGLQKPMPKEFINATNFVDGLAMVAKRVNGLAREWRFIDTKLQLRFPHIKTQPQHFDGCNFTLAPEREERRAVYVAKDEFSGAWGFMRNDGSLAIPPRYSRVRSYSGGLAMVVEGDFNPEFYFVNLDGVRRFEPRKAIPTLVDEEAVSDFDPKSHLCTIEPMPLGGENESGDGYYATYYTADGSCRGKALWGTAFHNGTAFMRYTDPDTGEERTALMESAGIGEGHTPYEVDFHTAQWGIPWIDDDGVTHYSQSQTSVLGKGSQYSMEWEIGNFSADHLAPATIVSPNGRVKYSGIVDQEGEFLIIYQVEGDGIGEDNAPFSFE